MATLSSVGSLSVNISATIGSFEKALRKVRRQLKSLSDWAERQLRRVAYAGLALAGGMAAALQKVGEAQFSLAKLNAVIKSTGAAAGFTSEQLVAMSKDLQDATTFGDDDIVDAMALMSTFTQVQREMFTGGIKAAMDMSATFGQDLRQSIIQLGTALNDPILGVGRLKRIGISFSEDQKKSIKQFVEANDVMAAQKVILDELSKEIGGTATAAAETFGGQIAQVRNEFYDLMQLIGEKFLDLIGGAGDAIDWIKEKMGTLGHWIQNLTAEQLQSVATWAKWVLGALAFLMVVPRIVTGVLALVKVYRQLGVAKLFAANPIAGLIVGGGMVAAGVLGAAYAAGKGGEAKAGLDESWQKATQQQMSDTLRKIEQNTAEPKAERPWDYHKNEPTIGAYY